ncbi:hypothetical protein AC1031_019474 [Aphanomyces cochlioides]|nr:hypothetical protein AC1031_019474 [Aphanomyces cochlioides]
MSGLDLYSNLLLIGLKVFSSETDANVMTGIPGIVAFLVGALLGGVLLDWTSHGALAMRQFFALRQLFVGMIVAVVLCYPVVLGNSRAENNTLFNSSMCEDLNNYLDSYKKLK